MVQNPKKKRKEKKRGSEGRAHTLLWNKMRSSRPELHLIFLNSLLIAEIQWIRLAKQMMFFLLPSGTSLFTIILPVQMWNWDCPWSPVASRKSWKTLDCIVRTSTAQLPAARELMHTLNLPEFGKLAPGKEQEHFMPPTMMFSVWLRNAS